VTGLLLDSPAEVVRQLLVDLNLGSTPPVPPASLVNDWPAYVGMEPSVPDNCLTVYDTTGRDFGRTMFDGVLITHYGIQLRVRALNHKTGWLKAHTARTTLSEGVYRKGVTVGSNNYLLWCLNRFGNVLAIGKDSPTTKRSIFTLNFMAVLRQL
jgi:hypothetical protein